MICGKNYGIQTEESRYKGIYISTTSEGILMKNVTQQWTYDVYETKYFSKNDIFYDLEFIPKYKTNKMMTARDIYSIDQTILDWNF